MSTNWDQDDDYPTDDWVAEVVNGDTRLGYWDWVSQQKQNA